MNPPEEEIRAMTSTGRRASKRGLSATAIRHKIAVLRTSPCVVSLVTPCSPNRMAGFPQKVGFVGSGTVIGCHKEASGGGDDAHSCIILSTATIFTDADTDCLDDIQVKVYSSDGYLCDGTVLACDFHYNLAAVRILSSIPLATAKLVDLDDCFPITEAEDDPGVTQSKIKILPGDMVLAVGRKPSGHLSVTAGTFSAQHPSLDCKELYSLGRKHMADGGGPAIDRYGKVIGIHIVDEFFLPSNVVSRWWKYYDQHGRYYRPFLGVKVANYHVANWRFLEKFHRKFRSFSSGVFVSQVLAPDAKLRDDDMIVQCNGQPVGSTLEFFEKLWESAGASVALSIKKITGDQACLSLIVADTPEHFFNKWPVPLCWPVPETAEKSNGEVPHEDPSGESWWSGLVQCSPSQMKKPATD